LSDKSKKVSEFSYTPLQISKTIQEIRHANNSVRDCGKLIGREGEGWKCEVKVSG
jgi:hypothetical protein